MKRIIVEGPDGSGKSTLIQFLMGRYPHLRLSGSYQHPMYPGGPPPSRFLTLSQWLADQFSLYSGPIIHNRLFYSEMVYGPILRNEIALTPVEVERYRKFLAQHSFLIYCQVPYEVLMQAVGANPQMAGVVENLRQIYHAYTELMADVSTDYDKDDRFQVYDFTEPTAMTRLTNRLDEYMMRGVKK